MAKRLIVIAGPTASGKTALSISLAQHFKAEIFSADARQFYRKLDIGTAKPTSLYLSAIRHHFIDTLEPHEPYNAGRFARDLHHALDAYFEEHELAILVGGSGLYIKAAIEGIDDLPPSSPVMRAKYNALYEAEGIEGLQTLLQKLDSVYFETVDQNNPQRLQRALEAIEASGKPFSQLISNSTEKPDFDVIAIGLLPNREELYERINARVDEMMEAGLLDEVRELSDLKDANALQTVGYKELFEYLDQERTLEEAVKKIKQHTRNYAKRQITWFKKQEGFTWFTEIDLKKIIKHLEGEMNV